MGFVTVLPVSGRFPLDLGRPEGIVSFGSGLKSKEFQMSGRSAAW
jgi:hypothetical protein